MLVELYINVIILDKTQVYKIGLTLHLNIVAYFFKLKKAYQILITGFSQILTFYETTYYNQKFDVAESYSCS